MAEPGAVPADVADVARPSLERRSYLWVRRGRDLLLLPVALPLATFRMPPWAVSLAGVVAALSTVFTLRAGHPGWTAVGFTVALVADAVDGAVARRQGVGSWRGKLFDQLCDSATFAALVLAAGVSGLAGAGAASLAVYLATAVVAVRLLLASLSDRRAFLSRARAGFAAHLPKLPFYVAFPAVLMGWAPAESVAASLWLVSGLAGVVLVGMVVREKASQSVKSSSVSQPVIGVTRDMARPSGRTAASNRPGG